MALITYPLNNITYSAEDAELFHSTRTSGVFVENAFDYSVSGADNNVTIGKGIAWIKNDEFAGKVVAQKTSTIVDMGIADSVYPRIDAIVLQFNANRNETEIVKKQGNASSAPTPPLVERNASVYELHLYHIRRNAGETSISSGNITDLRADENYCGLMVDELTKLDKTLSLSGYVADAKAVGDAISSAINSSVPNTRTINGFRLNKNISLSAKDVGSEPAVESEEHSGCYYRMVGGTKEWINPPSTIGVEYRTTERWNGKVVYTKLVDLGALGEAMTYKQVSHGIVCTKFIGAEGYAINDRYLRLLSTNDNADGNGDNYLYIMPSAVFIQVGITSLVGYNAYVTLRYIKD